MENILRILAAFLSTSAFATLLGIGLAVAAKKLRVEKDESIEKLSVLLPGLNCGACGYAGCEPYAEALASGTDIDITRCTPGGSQTRSALGEELGLETSDSTMREAARLACNGGVNIAVKDYRFAGYADCESVSQHFGGDKGCKYGCLGLGSCVKTCPVDAIFYTANGLVKVDEEKCIGCKLCVTVCPTGVMKMVNADSHWFVACNSRDKARVTKSLCSVGCIACRICERKFPEAGFVVTDNLSILDYNEKNSEEQASAAAACPPKCIINTKEKI